MSDFAKNLKRLMDQQRVSAAELCAGAKVPKSSVSEWLSAREPKLSPALVRVARFMGTTVDALITGQDPEIEIAGAVLQALESQFVTVHQGTYRLTLEKQVPSRGKRKGGDQ